MSSADRVRIGLVGAGRMGSVHLRALQRAQGVELAGVAEPVESTRQRLTAEGIRVFADVELLIESGALDGVLIAAPSDQHAELVGRLTAARVPILCEKPLGVRVADTIAAADAARAAGVLLQVGYWRRFVPELRALRDRIAAGELGAVYQIACMQWDHEPPNPEFRAHSGGIAVDMAVHELDQIRWLVGQEIEWLVAAGGPGEDGGRSSDPDAAVILAGLSGGAAATVSLGRRFPLEDSCWLELWASEGYERVSFMWDTAGSRVFLDAMVAQAESFAASLRGAPLEGAGPLDAVAALAAAQQASLSLGSPAVRRPAGAEA